MRCPVCSSSAGLRFSPERLTCEFCHEAYPIVTGIPILLDESRSVFRKAQFEQQSDFFFDTSCKGMLVSKVGQFLYLLGGQTGKLRYERLSGLLKERGPSRRVLVLGGSVEGQGSHEFLRDPDLDIVESDVSFGPRTQIILDGHCIPYSDSSFDCVIAQAVLEHVLDPFRCVREIHRVLKPNGIVYVETPFMQQVHGGKFDFHRFTHSGHRMLFRNFVEIESGALAGAGTVMLWSYQYLLLSLFGRSKIIRLVIKAFARLTGFWLRYLDHLAKWNPYSIESASCFYFMGERSDDVVSDLEILEYYEQALHRWSDSHFSTKNGNRSSLV